MSFDSVNIVVFIVSLLLAVGFHEAMHAFTAHWLGDPTAYEEGRLSINPLKHLDLYTSILLPIGLILLGLPPFFVAKPVPFNPDRVKYDEFGAALIGIAGPLTNLTLATIAAVFLKVLGVGLGEGFVNAAEVFVMVNVALFVFNMIPFPPLDGSRLLYALAPEPIQKVMYQIEAGGFMTIFIFIFLLFPVLAPVVVEVNQFLLRFLL